MIALEGWTTIRYRHAQGKGVRTSAKEVGRARHPVPAAMRDTRPRSRTRAKRPHQQLVPYAEHMRHLALSQQLIGSRLLRELRTLG